MQHSRKGSSFPAIVLDFFGIDGNYSESFFFPFAFLMIVIFCQSFLQLSVKSKNLFAGTKLMARVIVVLCVDC